MQTPQQFAFISQDQLLKRCRVIMILLGTLYPAWGPMLYWIKPDAYDSIPVRLLLGGSLWLFAIGSFYSHWIRQHISTIMYVILTLGYVHAYEMIWHNEMHYAYAFGGFIMILFESICFVHIRALMGFYTTVIIATVIGTILRPDTPTVMYTIASFTLIPVGFISIRQLLNVMIELKQSKEELLDLSAAVQTLFLPTKNEFSSEYCHLIGYYRAVDKCGGDWWKFSEPQKGSLRITVGDVMGHGPGSAMMTASVASYFKVLESSQENKIDLGKILEKINDQMTDNGDAIASHLMTMLAMDIDFNSGKFTAYFAGCPGPAVLKKSGEVIYPIEIGSPLGSVNFKLGKVEFEIAAGDRILIFTDGLIEAKNKKMEFGPRRMNKLIQETQNVQAQEALKNIVQRVDAFTEQETQNDDYTMIIVDIKKIGSDSRQTNPLSERPA